MRRAMIRGRNSKLPSPVLPYRPALAFVALALLFACCGCKSKTHTSDPRLQKIDEILRAQLPPGTTKGLVEHFLVSRGYRIEDARDKRLIIALVRHIDTETLQPVAARVTFHFDSNEKLLSYDLQLVPDAPLPP